MHRRSFLFSSAAAVLPSRAGRIRAVVFDGFAVFDGRPVAALAEALFPGHGARLMDVWRTRQFEYTWLRTMTGDYGDFRQVSDDALAYAAGAAGVELSDRPRRKLVGALFEMKCWPDVPGALSRLRGAGLRLALLSNMTDEMLRAGIQSSGLEGLFERRFSTDLVHAYKPDPRAYGMATRGLKLKRHEILFAAFAGWDAAGARAFGFPTYWLNRMNAVPEELGPRADGAGQSMDDLVRFAAGRTQQS